MIKEYPVCNACSPWFIRHFQGPRYSEVCSRGKKSSRQIFYVHVWVNLSGFKFISLFGIFRPQENHKLEYSMTCLWTLLPLMSRGCPCCMEAIKSRSQRRMQVNNIFTVNCIFCPLKTNTWRLQNIACNRNESKQSITHGKLQRCQRKSCRPMIYRTLP